MRCNLYLICTADSNRCTHLCLDYRSISTRLKNASLLSTCIFHAVSATLRISRSSVDVAVTFLWPWSLNPWSWKPVYGWTVGSSCASFGSNPCSGSLVHKVSMAIAGWTWSLSKWPSQCHAHHEDMLVTNAIIFLKIPLCLPPGYKGDRFTEACSQTA